MDECCEFSIENVQKWNGFVAECSFGLCASVLFD